MALTHQRYLQAGLSSAGARGAHTPDVPKNGCHSIRAWRAVVSACQRHRIGDVPRHLNLTEIVLSGRPRTLGLCIASQTRKRPATHSRHEDTQDRAATQAAPKAVDEASQIDLKPPWSEHPTKAAANAPETQD